MASFPSRPAHPDLAGVIREARLARGYSLSGLAALLGVTRRYVKYLQRGARCPSAVMAGRLQAVLGVPIPMPAISSSELTPRSLRRIRHRQERARLAEPPPEEDDRPRLVNGWAGSGH